jgi:nucleotide-binding universal stress UspA family protein
VALPELSAVAPCILVEDGDAFDGIIRAAEMHAVDLVVLGTHRRRLLQDIFVGTTIERVIRLGSRPVLMVNCLPAAPYRRILAAVDPEEGSAQALRSAAALGLLDGVDLTVLHAFELPGRRSLFLGDAPAERIEHHLSTTEREVRADLSRFLATAGLVPPPNIVAEEGRPASVIKEEVKRLRPDLLLIGARRHGALRRALLGSVASEVISDTECDILIVPSGQERP